MRKPIRIKHSRCGEEMWGNTYLWAPAEKTADEIQRDADLAAEQHLAAIKAFEKAHERSDLPHLEDCPDNMTIGAAKQYIADQKSSREEYDRLKREAGRSFGSFMCELGYAMLWDFGDSEIEEAHVNWGHNHGIPIDMSETKCDDIDVKMSSLADDDADILWSLL
jgi:hypothetical protein